MDATAHGSEVSSQTAPTTDADIEKMFGGGGAAPAGKTTDADIERLFGEQATVTDDDIEKHFQEAAPPAVPATKEPGILSRLGPALVDTATAAKRAVVDPIIQPTIDAYERGQRYREELLRRDMAKPMPPPVDPAFAEQMRAAFPTIARGMPPIAPTPPAPLAAGPSVSAPPPQPEAPWLRNLLGGGETALGVVSTPINAALGIPATAVQMQRERGVPIPAGGVLEGLETPQKWAGEAMHGLGTLGARVAQGLVELPQKTTLSAEPTPEEILSNPELRKPLEERGIGPAAGVATQVGLPLVLPGLMRRFGPPMPALAAEGAALEAIRPGRTVAPPEPSLANLPQAEQARLSRAAPSPTQGVPGQEPPRAGLPAPETALAPYAGAPGVIVPPAIRGPGGVLVPPAPRPEPSVGALPAPAVPQALPEYVPTPGVLLGPVRGESAPPAKPVEATMSLFGKKKTAGTPTVATEAAPGEGVTPAGPVPPPPPPTTPLPEVEGVPTARFGGRGAKTAGTAPEPARVFGRRAAAPAEPVPALEAQAAATQPRETSIGGTQKVQGGERAGGQVAPQPETAPAGTPPTTLPAPPETPERALTSTDERSRALASAESTPEAIPSPEVQKGEIQAAEPLRQPEPAQAPAVSEKVPTISDKPEVRSKVFGPKRPEATGEPGSEGTWPVAQMEIDPQAMQFKEALANEKTGETGALKHVQSPEDWKRASEGVVTLWRDPKTNRVLVADGHQRVAAAKRAGVDRLLTRFSEAKTIEEARIEGALTNLRAGSFAPTDAARLFREVGKKGDDLRAYLREQKIPANNAGIRRGQSLANLSPDIWDRFRRGEIPEDKAVAIGREEMTPEQQARVAESGVPAEDVPAYATRVRNAPVVTKKSAGLFGAEETGKSLDSVAARIETELLAKLRKEKRRFGDAAANAADLERAGHIDEGKATSISEEAGTLHGAVAQLLGKSGGVNDAVMQKAAQIDAGALTTERAVRELRVELPDILRKEHPELAALLGDAPPEPLPPEPTRMLFGGGSSEAKPTLTTGVLPPTEPPPGVKPPSSFERLLDETAKDVEKKAQEPPKSKRFGRRSERGMAMTPFSPDDWAGMPQHLAKATEEAMAKVKRAVKGPQWDEFLRNSLHRVADFARAEAPISRLERSRGHGESPTGPTAAAFYGQSASGKQAETLWRHGDTDFGRGVVQPIESAVNDAIKHGEAGKLSAYLVAKRVDTRYTRHGLDSGFDPRWASEFVAEIEAKHPRVTEAAQRVNGAFQALMDEFHRAGGITDDAYARIKRDNGEFYVPMERVLEREPTGTGTGAAGPLSPKGPHRISAPPLAQTSTRFEGVPKAGSTIKTEMPPVNDPLLRSFEHMRQMFARINQARTGKKLAEWYDADPAQAQKAGMKEVPLFGKGHVSFDDFYEAALAKDPSTSPVEILRRWEESLPAGTTTSVVGGKMRAFEFADPAVGKAMTSLRPDDAITLSRFLKTHGVGEGRAMDVIDLADKGLQGITGIRRITTTGINASFGLVQFPRDIITYLAQPRGSFGATARSIANLPRGYLDGIYEGLRTATSGDLYLPETKLSTLYDRLPVEGFYEQGLTRGPRGLRQTRFGRIAEAARPLTRAEQIMGGVESGPRKANVMNELAAMGKTLDDPLTPDEMMRLANAAAKGTIPFKAGSSASKGIARYSAYYNAKIQGIEQLRQWMRDNPKETAARVLALSVVPTIYFWAKNHNEEWYRRDPPYQRYGFWRPSEGVRIPHEPLIDLPGEAMQMFLDRFAATYPEEAGVLAKQFLRDIGNQVPIPIPFGDVLQPIAEVAADHSFFTGRSINPQSLKGVEKRAPEMVARATDPKIAAALSKWGHEALGLEFTTAEIAFLARHFLGPVGVGTASLADENVGTPEPHTTPVVGRFLPSLKASAYTTAFWDKLGEFEGSQRAASVSKARDDPEGRIAFGLPKSARGRIDKIKERLRDLSVKYDAAPDVEAKKAFAELMDVAAQEGIQIIDAALDVSHAKQKAIGR